MLALEPGQNRIEVVAYNGRDLIASDPAQAQQFVTTFLSRWGEAVERPGRRHRRGDPGRGLPFRA